MTDNFQIALHQFREKLELCGYSARVVKDYPESAGLFFAWLEKEENVTSVAAVLPEHLNGYHAYIHYSKLNKGSYLSSTAVRARLQSVKTFYQIMYREKLVAQDYSRYISMPKSKHHLPRHIPTVKQMQQLLNSIRPCDAITVRDRCILELLYATGIRNQELRELRVESLDISEKTLFVQGKGSKDRIVPVGEWVLSYLREYLAVARPQLVERRQSLPWLFLSKTGRKITNGNLGDLIKKYCRRAGIDYLITPHSFRHACATHLLKAGADIRYVQELLGHADLSATQIYTRIDISFLQQAHRRFHPREKQHDNGN